MIGKVQLMRISPKLSCCWSHLCTTFPSESCRTKMFLQDFSLKTQRRNKGVLALFKMNCLHLNKFKFTEESTRRLKDFSIRGSHKYPSKSQNHCRLTQPNSHSAEQAVPHASQSVGHKKLLLSGGKLHVLVKIARALNLPPCKLSLFRTWAAEKVEHPEF